MVFQQIEERVAVVEVLVTKTVRIRIGPVDLLRKVLESNIVGVPRDNTPSESESSDFIFTRPGY